jgi:hypothetical protein
MPALGLLTVALQAPRQRVPVTAAREPSPAKPGTPGRHETMPAARQRAAGK